MVPRARALLASIPLLLVILAPGCGEPAEPAFPSDALTIPSASASAAASAPIATPVLPPLPKDSRSPCDAAAATRKEADGFLAQGRSYKALRAVESADRQCPTAAQASWRTRLEALDRLGRDEAARALAKQITAAPEGDATAAAKALLAKAPPASLPAADSLLASALAARKSGAADARAQLDRALVRLEQETSRSPAVFLDIGVRTPLALSGDGTLAVLAAGNTAILVDAKTLAPRRFYDHPSPVRGAAVSPDGKLVATMDQSGGADVWSAATGSRVRRLTWADEEIERAVFSPDGKRLITAGAQRHFDAAVRVYALDTGDSVDDIQVSGADDITSIAVSRDGKLVAFGTERGWLELWSLYPHKQVASLAKKDSFGDGFTGVAFSPKGDKVAALCGDGTLTVWETKQGKQVWQAEIESRLSRSAVAFNADGTRVVASGESGFEPTLREWDAAAGTALQNRPAPVEVIAFSQDATTGIGLTHDEVGSIDVASGTGVTVPVAGRRQRGLLFGPPRTLVFGLDSEKALRVLTPRGARLFETDDHDYGYAISLDGTRLARAGYGEVASWDLDKGAPLPAYPPLTDPVGSISFGPSGAELRAMRTRFEDVSLIAAEPGSPTWRDIFHQARKDVRFAEMAAYGGTGALATDKQVFLVDASDGHLVSAQDDGLSRVDTLALSGDGRTLFVARDGRLIRHDARTGKRTSGAEPTGCYSMMLSVSFDGSRVVMGCYENSALFTFAPGQDAPQRTALKVGRGSWDTPAIAPHGDLIAFGHEDGWVRLWDAAGSLRAEIFALPGADATLVQTTDGRVLLQGKDAAKLEARLFCRVGSYAVPFAVCADALSDDRLLEEAFAPGG
jgi:WD40 repeat protein